MLVPISYGEFFDRYTILEIKLERIKDAEKLGWVRKEFDFYCSLLVECPHRTAIKEVNELLWDVEERIRVKEADREFDDEFIALARNVYLYNDRRAEIKRVINGSMLSPFQEVKSYLR